MHSENETVTIITSSRNLRTLPFRPSGEAFYGERIKGEAGMAGVGEGVLVRMHRTRFPLLQNLKPAR